MPVVARALVCLSLLLLSFSGLSAQLQGRLRFQGIEQRTFTPEDRAALQHRMLLSEQWTLPKNVNLALELASAVDSAEQNKQFSFDQNALDIHQLTATSQWQQGQLVFGRQVWSVGEQRLLGKRDGTNVRGRFDGLLVQHQFLPELQLKLYQGYHVKSLTGVFDDEPDKDLWVRGLVINHADLLLHGMQLNQQSAHTTEQRFSYEMEYKPDIGLKPLFVHAIYQHGSQGIQQKDQRIEAWFTQFRLSHSWAQLMLGLTGSYASGGSSADVSHRFVGALAKAPYYSNAGVFASTNLRHVGLLARWSSAAELELELDIKRLYRSTRKDGIFTFGKQPLPTAEDWQSTPVADTFSFKVARPLSAELEVELETGLIQPRAGVGLPTSRFLELTLHYRF